ncbi:MULTISPECIES: LysR family transcriptional regulator [Rhizobium]|uniref:HTH-type transcriptional regulator TtuA n=1 Tax=Rhizobium paranaense TaxID=1650438 RepID=A0A7W9D205_9HYPH|nr:LysR family transcriptional regulator [Rhizobium paranaense]MBB5574758.1 LysR family glycine cleavage system transcriptional activator [Rhizobium paranaense]
MNLSRSVIPDLAVLQAFECAARHGSFTQAALELNLTQSAVSRQIRTLEDQLHVNLFERIRKRVVLSSAGKAMLPEVRRILARTEEMVLRAMASSDGKNVLSIATLPTFGNRWLLRRLPDFLKDNPNTVLNIASRSEPFDLTLEDFDLAIHYGQPVWAHATCTYLCSEIIVPVASSSLLNSFSVTQAEDLERGPLLHLATRPRLWAEWFQLNGCEGVSPYHGSRFDQFSMVIEAAILGLGFALLPKYLIEEEIASGRLQIAWDRPMATTNNYYIVTPEMKQQSLTTKRFQEWLLNQVS